MQTQLEKDGISARQDLVVNNTYNKNNEYNEMHKNALADGDEHGKGTGSGGYVYVAPKSGDRSIRYSGGLDTSDKAGSIYDKEGRNGIGGRTRLTMMNIYGPENEYGPNMVDTSANVADGQIVIKYKK